MNTVAFLVYMCLAAFAPGPNTMMAMSAAARGGLRRGLIFGLGVLLGLLLVMSLCALFSSVLLALVPALMPVMRWVGAAYILFLALTILRDREPKEGTKRFLRPDSMLTGLLMQFVNITTMLYGVTSLSSFVLPYTQSVTVLSGAVLALALTGFLAVCCWAAFGALFQALYTRHRRAVNAILALLLCLCALMLLQT